jgi:hypothetical protein
VKTIKHRAFWVPSLLAAASLVTLGTGCKVKPAPDSGFLANPELMMAHRERAPFDRAWAKPGFNKNKYKGLIVCPVNIDYLMRNSGWDAANPANAKVVESAHELAAFTRDTFVAAFQEDPLHRFTVGTQTGPGVAVLELAIVQLVPSKSVVAAIGLAAPVAKAPAMAVFSKLAGGNTCVAIEGRLRDAQTGEVLMMFADREEPPNRIIDAKAITWYGDAKDSIETWAKQLVELANTPPNKEVKDAANFTLSPW